MENWDDQHFKSEWKQAFDGAEITPSEQVWTNIDARMMAAENASMKKRVVFYQRLAAASVGVLFLVSGYAFFGLKGEESSLAANTLTKQSTVNPQLNSDQKTTVTASNDEIVEGVDKVEAEGNVAESQLIKQTSTAGSTGLLVTGNGTRNVFVTTLTNSTEQTSQVYPNTVDKTGIGSETTFNDDLNIALVPVKLNPALPKTVKPNDLSIAYRIADAMPATSKKKRKGVAENSWAALGFGAGNFTHSASNLALMNANVGAKAFNAPNQLDASNSSKNEETKPGSSYSMSISGGKRVARRWLLHGGLSYVNQNSTSNTSTVTIERAFNAAETFNAVTSTEESEIKSTFQFISLPVQAGYMLVDQKFGVQLNGGFSPDVFLKSTVSDKASKETISTTGSNSTFKAVSLSGLGGVELSYRFSEHYRIALVPGFRYSLTPVYKENSLASAKPFMADIGLRFRYVF